MNQMDFGDKNVKVTFFPSEEKGIPMIEAGVNGLDPNILQIDIFPGTMKTRIVTNGQAISCFLCDSRTAKKPFENSTIIRKINE